MRPASWLALTSGVVLGGLAACFTSPGLSGPYRCGRDGGCPNPLYICRDELCCDPVSGDPPCPPEPPDGGEGDGGGGGCVIPNPPDCTVPNTFGPCRAGLWSCDGGTRHCEQLVQPGVESCTGQDENCNGVVNEFPPCGGPNDLLAPSGDFVLGGQRTSGSVQSQPTFCVKDRSGNTPDYFDGPVWRGVGGTTHFVYAEAADGGTWDLSGPNQSFHYTFAGTLVRPDSTPFRNWSQPLILVCGPSGEWRRYRPFGGTYIQVNGNSFSSTNTLPFPDGQSSWVVETSGNGGLDLKRVRRVEILIDLFGDGGAPTFDAGFTSFGFSLP